MNTLIAMHIAEMASVRRGEPVLPATSVPSSTKEGRARRRYSSDSGDGSSLERYRSKRRRHYEEDNRQRDLSRRGSKEKRTDHNKQQTTKRINHDPAVRGGKNHNKENQNKNQQQNKWSKGNQQQQVKKPVKPPRNKKWKPKPNQKVKTDPSVVDRPADQRQDVQQGTRSNPIILPTAQVIIFSTNIFGFYSIILIFNNQLYCCFLC